jgi:LacI family transcriptional regulator
VNRELQARVLASAEALGYSANAQAQAMARGTSNTVAVVVGDIADPYFSSIASGVIRIADERGLVVTLTATGTDQAREHAALSALRSQRPRAVILAGSRTVDGAASDLGALGRVAVIGSPVVGVRSVSVLNSSGAADLAGALVARGYSDFAVLAGPEGLLTARERTAGFLSVVPDALAKQGDFSRDGGYVAMAELLTEGERPECVFAVTDVMALGAMAAMRDAGLRPGEDIAIAGFDDIPLVQDVTPSLTTVTLPLAEIGARALELALSDDPAEWLMEPVAGVVTLRASTPVRTAPHTS